MKEIGAVHRAEYDADSDESEKVIIAEAPGRIHYLGEHGEPKSGLFLSSAIDRTMKVAVSLRKDNSLRFFAADFGERKRTTLVNLKYKREDRWSNYLKVAIHGFAELGYSVKGLNFTLMGDVPQQVGMASSSAIEVATAVALRNFFRAKINDQDMFRLLTKSSAAFFGKNSNPVDYLVHLHAKRDHFLVVDEKSHEVKTIKSPLSGYKILVLDSKVPRMGVEDELKQRRQDLRRGLELLSASNNEKTSFRNFAGNDLIESMGDLPEQVRRRCMHVVKEVQRVYEMEDALRRPEISLLPKIIMHSHESLRDLYEVSCPEIDWLVKRAQEIEGSLGSRMTGLGFGGCTYTIIADKAIDEYKKRLEDYERIFGFKPILYEVRPAAAARII
ncbi:MAG: galactokinase [Treponema sp.]|jgi:galactokinase|nr:galactokinase [Treponema sp.]